MTTSPPKPSALSEQGYGVGIYEQTRKLLEDKGVMLGTPAFPTLREEERLGYDLYLERLGGGAIILQFKLSKFARENRSDSPTFPKSRIGHHRFRIPFGDKQLKLLKEIEENAPDCLVRYVAPMFSSLHEYEERHKKGSLLSESYSFPPRFIIPDQTGEGADNYVVWLEEPIENMPNVLDSLDQPDSPYHEVKDVLSRIDWAHPSPYNAVLGSWQRLCTPEGVVLEGYNFEKDLEHYSDLLTNQSPKAGPGWPSSPGKSNGRELSAVLAGFLPEEEVREVTTAVREEYKDWQDRPSLLEAEISVRLGRRLGLDVMIPFRWVEVPT